MRALVVGDSCQDIFVYGDIDRICPEGPVPVFNREWEKGNNGMALNVVANLESLGAEVKYVTNQIGIVKTRYVDKRVIGLKKIICIRYEIMLWVIGSLTL